MQGSLWMAPLSSPNPKYLKPGPLPLAGGCGASGAKPNATSRLLLASTTGPGPPTDTDYYTIDATRFIHVNSPHLSQCFTIKHISLDYVPWTSCTSLQSSVVPIRATRWLQCYCYECILLVYSRFSIRVLFCTCVLAFLRIEDASEVSCVDLEQLDIPGCISQ